MALNLSLLQALQDATTQYIQKEKTRLTNEASVMEAVLSGRTGGRGIQMASTAVVSAVAYKDLAAYLGPVQGK